MSISLDNVFLYHVGALVKDYLWRNEDLFDFPIVTEDMGDVAAEVAKAERGVKAGPTGKTGCAIFLSTSNAGGRLPNVPAATGIKNRITVFVYELPAINRIDGGTLIPGKALIEVIAALLKSFRSNESGFEHVHFFESEEEIAVELEPESGLVVYALNMYFPGGIQDDDERLGRIIATPAIAIDAATRSCTITCGTADAFILYTTDGRRPWWFGENNPNNVGTLYEGAFDASAFETITARGFLPNWRASLLGIAAVHESLKSEEGAALQSESGNNLQAE